MNLTSYAGPAQRKHLDVETLFVFLKSRLLSSGMLALVILLVLSLLGVVLGPHLKGVSAAKLGIFWAVWLFLWAHVGLLVGRGLSDMDDYHSDLLDRVKSCGELRDFEQAVEEVRQAFSSKLEGLWLSESSPKANRLHLPPNS